MDIIVQFLHTLPDTAIIILASLAILSPTFVVLIYGYIDAGRPRY